MKADYRNEIFYPPAYYDFDNKPRILSAPATVDYGQEFVVSYAGNQGGGPGKVTGAVLVAPSSTTHSFNFNQRVVGLVTVSDDAQAQKTTVKVRSNVCVGSACPCKRFLQARDSE